MTLIRLALLFSLVLATHVAAAADGGEAPSAAPRPNILMILVDDLGYGDLSSFGAKDLSTPNIDRLVSKGIKLTQFYSNCPVCSPTRASLMTGCFPDVAGVPGVIRTFSGDSWGLLRTDLELLPAALKRGGYRTGMVGKWHLGLGAPNLPHLRGFDFFHGFEADMMDDYWNHLRFGRNYMRVANDAGSKQIDPEGHATDIFTEWACEWLRGQDANQPFFLYLAYNAPHTPIQPPPDWLKRYKELHPEVSDERARLAALIEHMDQGIARVLATLEATGLSKNTLVVFSSDNGGQLSVGANNGPLNGGKGEMLEGGIRVPTCAVWPGHIQSGSQCDAVALTMDLYPTFLEIAGVKPKHKTDGQSILPMLRGQEQFVPQREQDLFWVRVEGGNFAGKPFYAARRGPWKLLQNKADEPFALYNLADDPGETRNLAASHPEKYAEMKQILEGHLARVKDIPYRDAQGAGPGEVPGLPKDEAKKKAR